MNARERRRMMASCCWLISLIVHLCCAIAIALLLRPLSTAQRSTTVIEVAWAADRAGDLDTASFTAIASEPELESGSSEVLADVANSDPDRLMAPSHRQGGAQTGGVPSSGNATGSTIGAGSGRAEFFGTVASGDRFVFLLDMSLSMDGKVDQQGTRFDRAREELIRSIEQLHERQSFNVALFCYKTRPMFDDRLYARQFVLATLENKDRLKTWLRGVKVDAGTDPRDALETGVSMRPSAVFLLSDGDFNGPQRPDAGALFGGSAAPGRSAQEAQKTRVPIHTIAYEDPAGARNMQELSNRSGGQYRFVAASPEAERSPSHAVNRTEQFAATTLSLAKGHESLGHRDKAAAHYRQTIARYPGTQAASEAATRLERLEGAEN